MQCQRGVRKLCSAPARSTKFEERYPEQPVSAAQPGVRGAQRLSVLDLMDV
jgi:hypothetical protein